MAYLIFIHVNLMSANSTISCLKPYQSFLYLFFIWYLKYLGSLRKDALLVVNSKHKCSHLPNFIFFMSVLHDSSQVFSVQLYCLPHSGCFQLNSSDFETLPISSTAMFPLTRFRNNLELRKRKRNENSNSAKCFYAHMRRFFR